MPEAAAAFPAHGRSRPQAAQTKEVPQAVVKDLNKVTGLHFSNGTWGVIWTVIVGGASWLTHFQAKDQNSALTSLKESMSAVVASIADMKKETKDGLERMDGKVEKLDGKLERYGERLTRVEIEAGTHAKD